MKRTFELIIISLAFLIVGLILGSFIQPPPIRNAFCQGLFTSEPSVITIDEALVVIYEARDSHIIYKAALEAGITTPTEWTGDIAFQDYVINRYNKVIDLLLALNKAKPIPHLWMKFN